MELAQEVDVVASSVHFQEHPISSEVDRPGGGQAEHLQFLDGIRGFLSIYVAAFHFLAQQKSDVPRWMKVLQQPFKLGHISVAVFIVLSGFSLMLPVVSSPTRTIRGGTKSYFKRRAARIMPAYYASLVLSITSCYLLSRYAGQSELGRGLTPFGLSTHILLIHNWFLSTIWTLNGPHWSVAMEWQIYFFLPFVFLPVWRRGGTFLMLLVAGVMSIAPLIFLPNWCDLSWTFPWYLFLFTTGMAAATLARRDIPVRWQRLLIAAIVSLAVFRIALAAMFRESSASEIGLNCFKDMVTNSVIFCLLVLLSRRGAPKDFLRDILSSRLLVYAGWFSYSLYLTHWTVLDVMLCVAKRLAMPDTQALTMRALVGLPLAILLAAAWYRCFERPFMARRTMPKASVALA